MSPDMPPACCRTDVHLELEGEHLPAKVRSCDQLPDGTWSCLVTVRLRPGQVRTDRVGPERLR